MAVPACSADLSRFTRDNLDHIEWLMNKRHIDPRLGQVVAAGAQGWSYTVVTGPESALEPKAARWSI